MNKIKLLFVEDDASFAFIIKGSLELTDLYEVQTAANGKEGLFFYKSFNPDVIVSDIEMPVLNGIEMIKAIRSKDSYIPILFATGRTSAIDVIKGYELGVDNFIKKPFLPDELSMHIQAILKRLSNNPLHVNIGDDVYLGLYKFNIKRQTLEWENEAYSLTPKENEILQRLYERKNEIYPREKILEEIWGFSDFYTSRSLDVFINHLRKLLQNDPNIKIQTIRGRGLRLIV